MNARIAILAALPREIAPLIRHWPVREISRQNGILIAECDRAIAVCAGMGRERTALAFSIAETRGLLSSVISVGYAGALRAGIQRGTIWWPSTVIDTQMEGRYECSGGSGTLISVDRVLKLEEKRAMGERWRADLVDMEAATVARLAVERGLPFRMLKVVSDEAGDQLPDFNAFIDNRGQLREAAFAGHVLTRPWRIPATIRMGRNAARGSRAIAAALREVIGDTK